MSAATTSWWSSPRWIETGDWWRAKYPAIVVDPGASLSQPQWAMIGLASRLSPVFAEAQEWSAAKQSSPWLNVVPMPQWKFGATAAERLEEVLHEARRKPERFTHVVVVFIEQGADGKTMTRYITAGCTTTQALGALEMGKAELYAHTHRPSE